MHLRSLIARFAALGVGSVYVLTRQLYHCRLLYRVCDIVHHLLYTSSIERLVA